MRWKYIKGNEDSFKGSPEGAIERLESDKGGEDHLVGWLADGYLIGINGYKQPFTGTYGHRIFVTAKREAVSTDHPAPVFLPA